MFYSCCINNPVAELRSSELEKSWAVREDVYGRLAVSAEVAYVVFFHAHYISVSFQVGMTCDQLCQNSHTFPLFQDFLTPIVFYLW